MQNDIPTQVNNSVLKDKKCSKLQNDINQGTNITSSNKIMDLGVIIESNLKCHDHVNSVKCKANRTL